MRPVGAAIRLLGGAGRLVGAVIRLVGDLVRPLRAAVRLVDGAVRPAFLVGAAVGPVGVVGNLPGR
jgi:hypothetical protein